MKLGITTIQRDRASWIKEWVAFHYLVGFRKFYIFLHNCSDNTNEVLTELKKRFDIEIFIVNSDIIPHVKSYQYSCDNFLKDVDWMAFIDGDEFLFPTRHDSMETALNEFSDKKISAIGVYWVVFGSNGYIDEPVGLITENYKYRSDYNFANNRHIKSIVRGGQGETIRASGSHTFRTPKGTYDENLRPIIHAWTDYQPTYEKFRINHYVCQSRSYYLNFKRDHRKFDDGFEVLDESWWENRDRNEVLDHSMDKFIGPLKDLLDSI